MRIDRLESDQLEGLPPSRWVPLLRYALHNGAPPLERRIFVNRNLRMETIRHIGFDLDWTLADYERLPLEQLTFDLAVDRLIERYHYPEAIRQVELRADFPSRGLMIDKEAGTVLRMNRHRYVGRAYLGREQLEPAELARLYRHEPLRPSSNRFYHVDSLFELPEVNLFAEVVELCRRGQIPGPPAFTKIFADVRAAIDWVHGEGPLKSQILADIPRYLQRRSEVTLALDRLALGDRRLILLTNSEWRYVDAISSYLLDSELASGRSWLDLFDLVIVGARKPSFFRHEQPFVRLSSRGEPGGECDTPTWGGIYRGGSLQGLMRLLDVPGEQVLYIGDHIYGDIVTSKMESTWRTALIVTELEEELLKRAGLTTDLEELTALKVKLVRLGQRMDQLHDVLTLAKRLSGRGSDLSAETFRAIRRDFKDLARSHRSLRNQVSTRSTRVEETYNRYWGSLFKQASSKTLFGSQLESFACLYTSRVENFAFYGTNHYFRVLEDPLMHEAEPG